MAKPTPVPPFRLIPGPVPASEEVRVQVEDFFQDRWRALRRIARGEIDNALAASAWDLTEDPEAKALLSTLLRDRERILEIEEERTNLREEKRSLRGR